MFSCKIIFISQWSSNPPTVYADGSICLDILQNRWSPTYDVSSILTSIQVNNKMRYLHVDTFSSEQNKHLSMLLVHAVFAE